MNMIRLNDKQKEFLFQEQYVTKKVFDSLSYVGWEKYYIKNFYWKLDLDYNRWNMNTLVLINKDTGEEDFNINLNFQGNDLNKLMKIS